MMHLIMAQIMIKYMMKLICLVMLAFKHLEKQVIEGDRLQGTTSI